ncbi:NADPH:quinone oxidoreductase family protein [Bradyrhizobium manausense]|uniref:NADPH:quinone oxidoreductase family protein n=1 Tax=Bradyrhizobium TaxID=374 RepID=UPI001BA7F019|nr:MULTISPECIES: NADPH:quinone oxidoreductase family protein [Bradyrhizobium]MBR0827029.1 NADPH:quinone oxidoreductase family protein [Bradyrhizobium manausense]UVO32388.1 NADPH:quinone oxidoreductase family protein [Bradyrhizobium arachidis]
MKAVVVEQYAPIDQIELKDVPMPPVAAGQLRIKVHAAGIGFVDGLKVQGLYQTKDPLPFTPGTEFAGVVDEAPDNAAGYVPGMRVMGMARSGALAEYITVNAEAVHPLPDAVAAEVGASFRANYLTAHYALSARAMLAAGEQLLVLGAAGGVGIAAVQIGRLLGARVIAAASTPEKRDFARAHGADAVIDYTQPNWRDALKELTGGHGADVIFDPVGGEISVQAFRSIAWRGRHLVVGFAAGSIPALPFNLPLLKGGALLGVDLAQIPTREPDVQKRLMAELTSWLAEGKLKPVVGRVFAFADFRDAFKAMQTRDALGKMVVRISS